MKDPGPWFRTDFRAALFSLLLGISLSSCITARFWEGRRRGMDDFAVFAHLNPLLPLQYLGGVRPEVKKVDVVGWNSDVVCCRLV